MSALRLLMVAALTNCTHHKCSCFLMHGTKQNAMVDVYIVFAGIGEIRTCLIRDWISDRVLMIKCTS